jgi:hypothetical protein
LQRPFAHVQLFAHVRIIQPIHFLRRSVPGTQLPYMLAELVEPTFHFLKGFLLDSHYFHI